MTESSMAADELRVSGIVEDSIVDGPGLRLAVFTQGCPHRCAGCHNPHTHDYGGGELMRIPDILALARENPLLCGITLTGGEPFVQAEHCAKLARGAKDLGLNVYTYTGYTFEALFKDQSARALLEATDVLVDGPFIQAQRTLALPLRGSANQRVLDCAASLAAGRAVCV